MSEQPTTLADIRAQAGVGAVSSVAEPGPAPSQPGGPPYFWYCLSDSHNGEPLVHASRVFSTQSADGCPTCPTCKDALGRPLQVSAFPMASATQLPDKIQELARRQGLAEIVLKEG